VVTENADFSGASRVEKRALVVAGLALSTDFKFLASAALEIKAAGAMVIEKEINSGQKKTVRDKMDIAFKVVI
jgi:hypothetical protein